MRKICALVSVLFIAAGVAAQQPSKTEDYAQEPYVVEQLSTVARFEKDGTGRREVKLRVLVKTDLGVESWGQLVFGYNSGNEKLEIPYVRVRKADGSVVSASLDAIQDMTPNLTRDAPMYTDYREKHVTVPALRPGDTLEYDIVTTTHTALAPGQFWWEYDFEDHAIVRDEQVEVNVPKDREFTLKTLPGFDPKITDQNERKIYRWQHSNLKRKTDEELREEQRKRPKAPEPSAIRMTTFKSWEEVGAWYHRLETDRVKPNDAIRAKALELTNGKTSDLDKIEALYNYVSKNFRYVSLSFGLGRYQPHAAAEIFANQYGDCKDKHTLLAALLQSVGFPAEAALMNSSRKVDPELPSPGQFDHVITVVPLTKEDVWLDSTPEVSAFRQLFFRLRGKKALVVPQQGVAGLRDTPVLTPVPNVHVMEIDGKISDMGKFTAHVKHTLRGDDEFLFRSSFHSAPETKWDDVIRSLGGFRADITDIKLRDLADTSKPLVVEYNVAAANYLPFSRKVSDLQLPIPLLPVNEVQGADDDTSTEPLELAGTPSQTTFSLKLEVPQRYSLGSLVPVAITRDFGSYKATYKTEGTTITAERTLAVSLGQIPANRIRDYVGFTNTIDADQKQKVSIESKTLAGVKDVPADAKIDEVMQAGVSALQERDFDAALMLFKRATNMEPKNWHTWLGVGSALLMSQRYAEAEAPFRKVLEIDPYNAAAYGMLAQGFASQHKYDRAEEMFRKQVELAPLDAGGNGGLAQCLIQQRKWQDALPVLEKLVSLDRSGAWYASLGQVYLELGQSDKAIAALDRAAELDNTPLVWNNVAYELAKHDLQLERAQQYAESAVSSVSADLRNVTLDKISMREMTLVQSLGAYWDTLGWVHFRKGSLDKAERFINAAWLIGQHGEEGDHLAQVYEKRGDRVRAMKTYALAAAASTPFPEARTHLLALTKDPKKADDLVKQAVAELEALRTVTLARDASAAGSAEFLITLAPGPKVAQIKFLRGDDSLRGYSARITLARFNALFPDDTPTKIVRRGTLTCPKDGKECRFVLTLPEEVVSVD